MPPRQRIRERITERTGWTKEDSGGLRDELWKLRRYGATALLGGLLGGGAMAAWGTTTDIGGIELRSHVSMGSGGVLQVGPVAGRYRTGIPGEPGVIAEPIDVKSIDDVLAVFGDFEIIAQEVVTNTYRDVLAGAGVGAALMLGGKEAFYLAGGFNRRQRRMVGSVVTAVSLVAPGVAAHPSIDASNREWLTAAAVFDGITLDNVDVSGSFATDAVEMLQKNEQYYDELETKMRVELIDIRKEDATRGYDAWLFETDWHCREGMARVTGAVVEGLGVKVVLEAGDLVKGGIDQEEICIDIHSKRVYDKAEHTIAIAGNHDGPKTIKKLEDAGVEVLDDETTEIDGVVIYGASDPRLTFTGYPQTLRDQNEFISEFEARMNATVPEIKPDILLIHDAENLGEARASSLLTLSGHYHTYKIDETGRWIQGGTSGGTLENQQSYIGKLQTPSNLVVLYRDPETNEIAGHRNISINPDQEIFVSSFMRFKPLETVKIPPQLVK